MTRHEYTLLDVFTDRAFGGNQLAVFRDGRGLSDDAMQAIATEMNLAETTFVLPVTKPDADHRVRIFTPAKELPFAGHPTLGTAFVLAQGRDVTVRLEEGVGIIPVTFHDGFGQMVQVLPKFEPAPVTREALAQALSLETRDVRADVPLELGSSGVRFIFAPLRDLDAVGRARPRPGLVTESVYLFAMGGVRPGTQVHGRMFGFSVGIAEDAASGSAQGPLGAYLVRHGLVPSAPSVRITSEQGFEMGRPARIEIEVEQQGGATRSVKVGGRVVPMGGGWLDL
jgi:trans-2,3-dihydro-3-hydroxyanthranilate isomerase